MPIELFDLTGIPLAVIRGVLLTAAAVIWTLVLVRIVGLRSFSKMTPFDFVATVATASLIATGATSETWPGFVQAIAAVFAVFLVQWLLARAMLRWSLVNETIRNEPLLLVRDGRLLHGAMNESRVSRSSLMEKIRASGATSLDDVRAVVLETTGDVTVLTGGKVDPRLMEGVRGYEEG